jgi:signal transduction histidine kinase
MLVVALPLLGTALYLRLWTARSLVGGALREVASDRRDGARILEGALAGVQDDALFLSRAPQVVALAEALVDGDTAGIEDTRTKAEDLVLALSASRPHYAQLRFISREGREIVRIEANGGSSWVVPRDELRDRSKGYYFRKALSVPSGHVYVSPLNLHREPGIIARPLDPVMRYATPVYLAQRPVGVAVIIVRADRLLAPIRDYGSPEQGRRMLVDQNGFYLAHHLEDKQWGGPDDLNTGADVRSDYGSLAADILSGRDGTIEIGEAVVSYQRVQFCPSDADRYWVLLQEVPKHTALAPVRRFRLALGGVFGVSLLGTLLLTIHLSRRLSEPLQELRRGAELVGSGDLDQRVDIHTGDELEILADAFNEMAERLGEARDQERLAFIGRMAAGIVHDIKNPLTSIRGFTDLLAATDSPDERKEFAGIVTEDTNRILSMVQELLDFSRGRSADLHLTPTSLRSFLSQLEQTIRRDMEPAGIEVAFTLIEDAWVRLDAARMTRVVLNIASNAREAMQGSGGSFSVQMRRAGEHALVVLQDTGPGIPEEIADSLFEPFVTRTKEHGTGLGLAVCKQIVEAHGGTVRLDPGSQKGARFVIELPATRENFVGTGA